MAGRKPVQDDLKLKLLGGGMVGAERLNALPCRKMNQAVLQQHCTTSDAWYNLVKERAHTCLPCGVVRH